jgi:hypothetical protein
VGGHVAGAVLVRVLWACACSGWVRLGGAGECVARRSDCSIVVHLLGMRASVSLARRTRGSRCLAANYLRAGFLAAGTGAPSGPHFIVISTVSTRRAGRVHSWYVLYP